MFQEIHFTVMMKHVSINNNAVITVFSIYTVKYRARSQCDDRGKYCQYRSKKQLLLYLLLGYVKSLPKNLFEF